ncbi:hypothetical protein [Actinoplanes italicus]|uniref:hypothetical protein n=1 Tax=Actinoplanes italicus TaxID=113567 RepID=UPI0023B210F8|nr:hypothetical protein [Actinoplanes italicus]
MNPAGLPIWTAEAMPGHLHDLSCAREAGVTAALNWAAAELDRPRWPTRATKVQVSASKPRPGSRPTASSSLSPTAP